MKFKKLVSALCAAIFIFVVSLSVYADSSPMMVQSYIKEENLDIFLSGSFNESKLNVKVANQTAEILDCGSLHDKSVPIRTIILLDISGSIPLAARENVLALIRYKIENISSNEQISIVTFSSKVTIVQDFTSDRYDLAKSVDKIRFNGKQSAVYDAIYNTIQQLDDFGNKPCFYQTIVITDGADDTKYGVTKEELFIRLQSEFYPLDVIRVSKTKPTVQNKDLSALARISNGRYFEIYSDTDMVQLYSDISVNEYFWIRAEIPVDLLDGSTRQIDVLDKKNHVSFDMKMTVVDKPIEKPATSKPASADTSNIQQTAPLVTSPPATTASDDDEYIGEHKSQLDILLLAVVAAGAVALIVIVIVSIVMVGRKKRKILSNSYLDEKSGTKVAPTDVILDSEITKYYTIKLSNVANQDDSWKLDVFSEIIIGRAEDCNIVIDEKSVSREQCKIAASKNGLLISNLSSSNKTRLNDTILETEMLLHPADNIRFGRIVLYVNDIQMISDESQADLPKIGNTKSIF